MPQTDSFQHCHGHGCRFKANVMFSKDNWTAIEAVFAPLSSSAADERQSIKQAIAIFEHVVGNQAGTADDKAATSVIIGSHELDCVDESTNTTVYLMLLQEQNLLKMHDLEAPSVRLPIIHSGRWPHQTAVIREIKSGERFVVDSWFHKNGVAPEIVTLKAWKDGWNPSTTVH